MTTAPDIHGVCPPRFDAVKDAFAANFTDAPEGLNEQAARFTRRRRRARPSIDLWAGSADPREDTPFTDTTLTPVFSTGKAVMALLIATAVERGKLSYEETVADLWPAYGAGRQGRGHRRPDDVASGRPARLRRRGRSGHLVRPQAVLDRLAAQAPMWPPGTASGYHPITIGYLAGELFRLADGRSMGTALREDFAEPFGLDLWIGLPEAEHGRVAADAQAVRGARPRRHRRDQDRRLPRQGLGARRARLDRVADDRDPVGQPARHGAGSGADRWGSSPTAGALDGQAVLSPAVLAEATRERIHGPRQGPALRHQLGGRADAQRRPEHLRSQSGRRSATAAGAGRCVFADPDERLSAAYVMTRQSPHLIGDPRAQRLIDAVYSAL